MFITSVMKVKGTPEIEATAKAEIQDSKEKDEKIAFAVVKKAFRGLDEKQKEELLEVLKEQ